MRFKACTANTLEKLRFNEESKINPIYRKQYHKLAEKIPRFTRLITALSQRMGMPSSNAKHPNDHPADPDFNSVKSFFWDMRKKTDVLELKWTPRQLKLLIQRIPIKTFLKYEKNLPNRRHADFLWPGINNYTMFCFLLAVIIHGQLAGKNWYKSTAYLLYLYSTTKMSHSRIFRQLTAGE